MAEAVVVCGHCGLQVPITSIGDHTISNIDMAAYIATCRRAKDLPAYSTDCPELQRALENRSTTRQGNADSSR